MLWYHFDYISGYYTLEPRPLLWHFNLGVEVESQNVIDTQTDMLIEGQKRTHTDIETERQRETDRYKNRGRKPLQHRNAHRYVDTEAERHRQI